MLDSHDEISITLILLRVNNIRYLASDSIVLFLFVLLLIAAQAIFFRYLAAVTISSVRAANSYLYA
jgi:hypothetical protein